MNGRVQTEDVEGLVEATNANGVKVGGSWCNLSQFGPKLELPPAGSHVRMAIDSKGYIRTIETLDRAVPDHATADPGAPELGKPLRAAANLAVDGQSIRLQVLRAAAEFVGLWGQTREDVRSEHVLVLADRWLKWVEGQ